jgi:hypothetical protein
MPISHRKNRSLHLPGTGFFKSPTAEECRLLSLNKEETIMFHAISWFLVLSLFALWSLAAWAFHSITAWTVANAGVLAEGSGAIEALRVPDWLAPWIPPELALAFASMLSAFTPVIEAVLGWAPALAGGLSVAVWVVWAIGSALLIVLGVVLSAMIAVLRRRSARLAVPSGGPAAAG